LQKRPIILRSLLIVATPYEIDAADESVSVVRQMSVIVAQHMLTHIYTTLALI